MIYVLLKKHVFLNRFTIYYKERRKEGMEGRKGERKEEGGKRSWGKREEREGK